MKYAENRDTVRFYIGNVCINQYLIMLNTYIIKYF